jgi:hypothetical protein
MGEMIIWDKAKYPIITEQLLQLAVAQYVQWWRCFVVPNLCLFHEMDVAVLTRAGCLWEFEIKCSQQDWNNDRKKDEANPLDWRGRVRRNLKQVSRFYYVVAPGLKVPDWLGGTHPLGPEHVTALASFAGILRAREGTYRDQTYIVLAPEKRAKSRRVEKLNERQRAAIYTAAHRRFWTRAMGLPPGASELDRMLT